MINPMIFTRTRSDNTRARKECGVREIRRQQQRIQHTTATAVRMDDW
jgi:hypothetical protein